MLNNRQKLTLEHLHKKGITDPRDIISHCEDKLLKPRYVSGSKSPSHLKNHSLTRKHSKEHYKGIIQYFK